jgi:hypothetical protein
MKMCIKHIEVIYSTGKITEWIEEIDLDNVYDPIEIEGIE